MKIIEKSNFKGLFSEKQYQKDAIIHKLQGKTYNKPSRTTIEIGKNIHIDDNYGIYMNHSFSPNCIIKNGCIVAIKNIKINEELTFNYNENETSMAFPFVDNITKKKVSGKENKNS